MQSTTDRVKARRLAWRRLRLTALISMTLNLAMLILVIVLLCTRTSTASTPLLEGSELGITSKSALPQSSIITCELATSTPKATSEYTCAGEYIVTAYCPCVKCCGTWSAGHPTRIGTDYIQKTASGTIPTAGRTIAADTSVLPFGTVVVIDGLEFVVEDRGSAIEGNRIDIFFETHEEALNWGKQTKMIYIKGDF